MTRTPRPSAPFAYSNIWGLNFACFLPFFLVSWWGKDAGWRRPNCSRGAGAGTDAGGAVPQPWPVGSTDRVGGADGGAVGSDWEGEAAGRAGHGKLLVLGLVLLLTPLNGMIQTRLDNPTSNEGRTNLGVQTIVSVSEGSPVVGFGTTRDVQGNFQSHARGRQRDLPHVQPARSRYAGTPVAGGLLPGPGRTVPLPGLLRSAVRETCATAICQRHHHTLGPSHARRHHGRVRHRRHRTLSHPGRRRPALARA